MNFVPASHIYLLCLAQGHKCVYVLVGSFNQEKALVGASSVIVKSLQTFVCSFGRHDVNLRSYAPRSV